VVATAAAALSVIVAYRQNVMSRSASHGDSLGRVLDMLGSDKMREDRATMYSIRDRPLDTWTPEEYRAAERVAGSYAQIGFLMKHRYLGGQAFIDWWKIDIVAAYQIIAPLIEARRAKEQAPSHFVYFEWLARTAYDRLTTPNWYERSSWSRFKDRTAGVSERLPIGTTGLTRPNGTGQATQRAVEP